MHSNYFFRLKIAFHKGFSAKQFSFWNSINLHFLMLMNRDAILAIHFTKINSQQIFCAIYYQNWKYYNIYMN